MAIIIISVIVIIITCLLFYIGGKVRDNIVIDKANNEKVIDVNDAVKFLGKNKEKKYLNGILFLTNRRLLFYKQRFDWLNIIPFLGEALSTIFINKNIELEIPVHQIMYYEFKPIVINYDKGPAQETGYTTFFTKQNEEYKFDIYVLDMEDGKIPDILIKLDTVLQTLDNPTMQNPN